jgi:hypothetical protein
MEEKHIDKGIRVLKKLLGKKKAAREPKISSVAV